MIHSTGHAQPPPDVAYKTEDNPVTMNPEEQCEAQRHSHGDPVERRLPTDMESPRPLKEAIPPSSGYGSHDAPEVEERFGITAEKAKRNKDLNGEKMRPLDEGEVADAVSRKPGASGSQPDLASDFDRWVTPSISNTVFLYLSRVIFDVYAHIS